MVGIVSIYKAYQHHKYTFSLPIQEEPKRRPDCVEMGRILLGLGLGHIEVRRRCGPIKCIEKKRINVSEIIVQIWTNSIFIVWERNRVLNKLKIFSWGETTSLRKKVIKQRKIYRLICIFLDHSSSLRSELDFWSICN